MTLPAFGLDLNWAMCRNPMCPNFGVDLDVDLPDGRKQQSSERYTLKTTTKEDRLRRGECTCRYCGQNWQLHSNRAVRVIAHYFLSLSIPFATCPNAACENHGFNVYEHWRRRRGPSRRYRRHRGEHMVRCRACLSTVRLGTQLRPRQDPDTVRQRWGDILDGLYTSRSATDTYEQLGIRPGTYYSNLRCIGARVRDYHSFRNGWLLHPQGARRDKPACVYTDVLEVSLQAHRKDRRHRLLSVIVSTLVAEKKIFVLAAHPYFLPERFAPRIHALRQDEHLPQFAREWCSLLHADAPVSAYLSPDERQSRKADERRGYFIAPPYATVAHFLVVQKMLSRFPEIHCYMDGAKELCAAAVVALRGRILAGGAEPEGVANGSEPPPRTAEIVLYQHKKGAQRPDYSKPKKGLSQAWNEMEKRFDEKVVGTLLKDAVGKDDPKVRAAVFRLAFTGAYSPDGGWAWLHHPPETDLYRLARTLWVTRMPGKTDEKHRKAVLSKAMLQPVDSIMNSMRARVRSVARPLLRAVGRSYRSNNVLPQVVLDELSVYLLRQNYGIRRRTSYPIVPATTWGLLDKEDPPLDVLACAWDFPRLGIDHAALISGWPRT